MNHPRRRSDFRHTALLYAGGDGFLSGTVPFVREGLEREEPVLVMVPGRRIEALRSALGPDAGEVHFADMAEVGANPARIIPAWRRFVSERARQGSDLRGIGEPIWAGRSDDELVECQRHEALLNVAFGEGDPIDLLCPYDTLALPEHVIEEARRSHPTVCSSGAAPYASAEYLGPEHAAAPFSAPLPPPPESAAELGFDRETLDAVRALIVLQARDAGLSSRRSEDLMLAVNELASNSIEHGGGHGTLRIWHGPAGVVAEVADRGRIDRPLAGRERPAHDQVGGHGLWLVNQLCDLMQMRTYDAGSVVRVHVRAAGRGQG
jgi:anti-sigma regulatory factor (Ser/Thr protein kinase)